MLLQPKVLFALLAVLATTPTAVRATTATCTSGNPKVAEQPTATPADCHHDDERRLIQRHLATKTPYRVVANLDDAPADYAGCRPTRIWAMVRHGTRHPNRRIVRSMAGRLRQLRDDIVRAQRSGAATAAADGAEATLCKRDVELFEHWPPAGSVAAGLRESGEMELTAEGHAELAALAERMQNRFADLMPDVYRNQSYLVGFGVTITQHNILIVYAVQVHRLTAHAQELRGVRHRPVRTQQHSQRLAPAAVQARSDTARTFTLIRSINQF